MRGVTESQDLLVPLCNTQKEFLVFHWVYKSKGILIIGMDFLRGNQGFSHSSGKGDEGVHL